MPCLCSLFSTSLVVALRSRFLILVVTLGREVQTVGWKSHLVVQGHGARQEKVSLNSKERFVLMLGHCALACYKEYLLLFMECVLWVHETHMQIK